MSAVIVHEELFTLAEQTGRLLLEQGLTLATAESCTGGGLAFLLTSVAGSSDWFERGLVTYSNESKIELLGVSPATIEQSGAVSEATAVEMAEGTLAHTSVDLSVAITGIAGPGGGTADKPVGTVCFAWSQRQGETISATIRFDGDRQQVRELSILTALQGVMDRVERNRLNKSD